MNILDIISLVVFFGFVIICAWRGLLKIISGWAAFFVAMIVAKTLGKTLGLALFKVFAPAQYIITVILFVVLFFVLKLLFGMLSGALTRILHTKTLDRILGGLVGVLGGSSVLFLLAFVLELVCLVLSYVGLEEGLLGALEASKIFKIFLKL